ncbi:MAG: hypothetical protein LN416_08810 [Candidatus Thermoplasmatota archaeon]|nr:hypothetical protein [Candidatus Thermoplasmatota archaeon]MCJ2670593.1 hypothetical protein [Candidatus Thermoplasmatota archaeon]MCK4456390.1 hypothetical protein [Thermoplasmata archaeon]
MGLIDKFVEMYQTPEGKMRLFRILFWISTAFMLFGLGLIVLSVFG